MNKVDSCTLPVAILGRPWNFGWFDSKMKKKTAIFITSARSMSEGNFRISDFFHGDALLVLYFQSTNLGGASIAREH